MNIARSNRHTNLAEVRCRTPSALLIAGVTVSMSDLFGMVDKA